MSQILCMVIILPHLPDSVWKLMHRHAIITKECKNYTFVYVCQNCYFKHWCAPQTAQAGIVDIWKQCHHKFIIVVIFTSHLVCIIISILIVLIMSKLASNTEDVMCVVQEV